DMRSGKRRVAGLKSLITADGEWVNHLAQGQYEVVQTGDSLTSNDPNAPGIRWQLKGRATPDHFFAISKHLNTSGVKPGGRTVRGTVALDRHQAKRMVAAMESALSCANLHNVHNKIRSNAAVN